jgi:hypothetical protein
MAEYKGFSDGVPENLQGVPAMSEQVIRDTNHRAPAAASSPSFNVAVFTPTADTLTTEPHTVETFKAAHGGKSR